MVGQFGYRAVPLEPHMPDYEGMIDYVTGNRFAFIAAKQTDLSQLRAARLGGRFAKADHLSATAMLAVRSVSSAASQLARPGVRGRRRVARDLIAAYRHRAERMSELPLN
jgi:hypothetical protein